MQEDDIKYCLQGIILVGYGWFPGFSEITALLFGV